MASSMQRTNHTFQSLWVGDALSPYEKMCLKSFIDHGHAFHLYTYSSQLKVPDGVELKDAADLLDLREYFTQRSGTHAGSKAPFSDLFRYKLLAERGGWWVDTDVVCLTSKIPKIDEFYAHETDKIVNNAVLFFSRSDPLMLECFQEAARIRGDGKWGATGPLLLTGKLQETGRFIGARPETACYPIFFRDAFDVLRPTKTRSLADRTQNSLMLHLWNETFGRSNLSKTMLPPRGSLLRQIADRHPVEGWQGEYDPNFLEQTLNLGTELANMRKELVQLRKAVNKRRKRPLPTVARKIASSFGTFVTRLQEMLTKPDKFGSSKPAPTTFY